MELKSLKDTQKISKKISNKIKPGDIIFLHGEIGAGKTTFVRYFINYLEIKHKIKKSDILSPTFNIVYNYIVKKIKINHYDLFRLKNYKDILQLGIFENLNDHITLIEWPELIKNKPKNRIDIFFKYSKLMNYRIIKINGHGKWKGYKFD